MRICFVLVDSGLSHCGFSCVHVALKSGHCIFLPSVHAGPNPILECFCLLVVVVVVFLGGGQTKSNS